MTQSAAIRLYNTLVQDKHGVPTGLGAVLISHSALPYLWEGSGNIAEQKVAADFLRRWADALEGKEDTT